MAKRDKRYYVLPGKSVRVRRGIVSGDDDDRSGNFEVTLADLGCSDEDNAEEKERAEGNLERLEALGYLEYATDSTAQKRLDAKADQTAKGRRRIADQVAKSRATRVEKAENASSADPRQAAATPAGDGDDGDDGAGE